jgi:tryptophanyl-tRNA synthetase
MSKSYGNTLSLRDSEDTIIKKIKTMQTDPARVRRTDPGDPDKCPVWEFHQIYSGEKLREELAEGCRSASIGCIDCKKHVIDKVLEELKPIQQRAKEYQSDLSAVEAIINEGCEVARDEASDTMEEVRKVMGLVR